MFHRLIIAGMALDWDIRHEDFSRILTNPTFSYLKAQFSKSEELRYIYYIPEKKVYIVDADIMTHGILAQSLGFYSDWKEKKGKCLCGFIVEADLYEINKDGGLVPWIEKRHKYCGCLYIESSTT